MRVELPDWVCHGDVGRRPHIELPHCATYQHYTKFENNKHASYPKRSNTIYDFFQKFREVNMPRGGEFDDGPTVQSDNAIESGENKIAGAPQGDSDVSISFIIRPCQLSSPPPASPPFSLSESNRQSLTATRSPYPPASTALAKPHPCPKALAR